MLLMDKPSKISIESSERKENLKEDPQKKEKKILNEKKEEIRDFLVNEFKESKYYKRKMEEYKLNKLMGNIRKKAKGPNPLSVKKKNSYYVQKEKDLEYKKNMMENNININNNKGIELNEENENNNQNENNQEHYNKNLVNINENQNDNNNNNTFIKKKRKRKHKHKKKNENDI